MWLRRAILILSLISSGCAALIVGAAAGAGSVAYFKGELKSVEKGTVDQAYQATLRAVDQLQMFIIKKQKDKTKAMISARRADDTKVTVRVRRLGDEVTEIRIRVGVLGDEGTSRQILEEIKKGF
ncbi:MAG: DUF3568 family protein [Candidatus Omnitrophica bacterium]|nr:DUF3568 family protein [Candidatus Omnitrophota bacterium]